MGLKNSKLVISPSEGVKGASGDEIQGTIKEVANNGVEVILKTAAETDEIPPADGSAVAVEGDESKCSAKCKKNPITWIQKKISFKKLRTPKKQSATVEPEAPVHPEAAVEVTKEESKMSCTETQSEEVAKVDQGAGHTDTIGPEPIVEIAPATNGIHGVGDEHYEDTADHAATEVVAEVEEKSISAGGDLELNEKLANLGIDHTALAHNGLQNGLIDEQ